VEAEAGRRIAKRPARVPELIAEAEHLHGPQIERALAMLRSAAEKSPLLARAMSRAEG